jgi:hypothetical protein
VNHVSIHNQVIWSDLSGVDKTWYDFNDIKLENLEGRWVIHEPPQDEIRLEFIVEIHRFVDPCISKPRGDDPQMETNYCLFKGNLERFI